MRAFRLLGLCVLLGSAGCSSCGGGGAGGAKEDLALVPKESDMLFSANAKRMRNTAMWRKLLDLRDSNDEAKKKMAEFIEKCGLDPFQQIDSAFGAFPQGQTGDDKEFAIILRGTFDEAKLVKCATDQAKKDGSELATSDYNGKKLYSQTASGGQAFATLLDSKTAVLGGKEWIKKVVDLATGKTQNASAKDNEALMALVKRVKTQDAVWGVGLVPQSMRDKLKNDPNLSAAGSMKDAFGSVDFAGGFAADLNVDLGSDADATEMQKKITEQLTESKKNPQVMMMGLAPLIDGIKIEAKAATFHVAVNYNQQQVEDIITRVKGMFQNLGRNLGQGAPGLPAPAVP
jgi:major membrane immunogen (membrane-anchored lipoprotein)